MKAGLSTLYLITSSSEVFVRDLEKYGADCKIWELVDDGMLSISKNIKMLKKLQRFHSFEYLVHGPFSDLNIASLRSEVRDLSIEIIKRSILDAVELEAKRFILHPGFYNVFHFEDAKSMNLKSISKIAEYAEKVGVSLTIENMPKTHPAILCNVSDFKDFFDNIDHKSLGLTLDFGHANLIGEIESFIKEFKDRLNHFHVHNNNGNFDSHMSIEEGTIIWDKLIEQVKSIGYRDYLTVESTKKPFESYLSFKSLCSLA